MNTKKLIITVASKPILWDSSHQDYSSETAVEDCWEFIAQKMNTTDVNNIRKRWKTLENQFKREYYKFPNDCPENSDNPENLSAWPYFADLLFLKNEISKPSLEYLEHCTEETFDCGAIETDSTLPSPVNPQQETLGKIDVGTKLQNRNKSTPFEILHNPKKKTQLKKSTRALIRDLVLQITKDSNEFDDDMKFFHSLLPHIKKIPPQKKLSFRNKINSIVNEFAYENC